MQHITLELGIVEQYAAHITRPGHRFVNKRNLNNEIFSVVQKKTDGGRTTWIRLCLKANERKKTDDLKLFKGS